MAGIKKSKIPGESIVKTDETAEGLLLEKQRISDTMKQLSSLLISRPVQCKQKNAKDSIQYRKKGNELYCSKKHNAGTHQQIWNLYTQSIATAPNDSEELALAYGNRSALLFHLKEYEECIKDCDQGIQITSSDLLKAKLLFRKIESLVALEKPTAKTTCKEAVHTFAQLELNADVKDKFIEKLNGFLNTVSSANFKEKKVEKKEESLVHQTEAPCASTAVSIKYDENWGRHIVATRKIEPGEILAIEKSYLTTTLLDGMYLFCNNCIKQTWASIPCESCIYNVYCSEECKSEAWKKYHEFECSVLSYMYNLDFSIYPYINMHDSQTGRYFVRQIMAGFKLLLTAVSEVGGINEIRKELISIQNCKDPRTKGFSDEGVFESDKCRSVYSLTTSFDQMHKETQGPFVVMACVTTYYLAKETTFFGKKLEITPKEMMLNEDIKLIGALLLKSPLLLFNNNLKYFAHRENSELGQKWGASLHPFCSLFNHSCDPNIKSIPTKNNERIVYSKHAIEEGEQLFLCYIGENYTTACKDERLNSLRAIYHFKCKCIACKENWRTLPCVKDLLKDSLRLRRNLANKHKYIEELKNKVVGHLQRTNYKYDPEMMKSVSKLMKEHKKHITQRSLDYETFEHFIYMMLVNAFGTWFNIPDTCQT